MSASLRVLPPRAPAQTPAPAPGQGDIGERIRQLQAEAKSLAREHVDELVASLLETRRIAGDVAAGGEAYPIGVREIARRLLEDMAAQVQAVEALMARF